MARILGPIFGLTLYYATATHLLPYLMGATLLVTDVAADAADSPRRCSTPGMRSAMASRRRLIVGISGASGIVYGVRLLEPLRGTDVESHLIVSRAAELTRSHELPVTAAQLRDLADVAYANANVGAAIASGSSRQSGWLSSPVRRKRWRRSPPG
ncbi:MAG: flavoprotein [Gemmataceae bacterium]